MAKSDHTRTEAGDGKGGQAAPADRRTVAPTPDYGAGQAPGTTTGGREATSAVETRKEGSHESVYDTARERVASEAQHARDTAAETAEERAKRIREAGEAFEEDSYAREAADVFADRIDQAARSMREADLGGMAEDLTEFARRQPLVFFGGAALLGFAAARMLKASERADDGYGARYSREASRDTRHWDDDPWRTV
jgi:hypothetical protein